MIVSRILSNSRTKDRMPLPNGTTIITTVSNWRLTNYNDSTQRFKLIDESCVDAFVDISNLILAGRR